MNRTTNCRNLGLGLHVKPVIIIIIISIFREDNVFSMIASLTIPPPPLLSVISNR